MKAELCRAAFCREPAETIKNLWQQTDPVDFPTCLQTTTAHRAGEFPLTGCFIPLFSGFVCAFVYFPEI